jgi:hypothetical protein
VSRDWRVARRLGCTPSMVLIDQLLDERCWRERTVPHLVTYPRCGFAEGPRPRTRLPLGDTGQYPSPSPNRGAGLCKALCGDDARVGG